jgi:hypothetical protein
MVTFGGQTGVIVVVTELVTAITDVVTVDVSVAVAVSVPPNGEKRRIVESGAVEQVGRVGAMQAVG